MLVQTEFCGGGRQWVVNVVAEHISMEACVYAGKTPRQGSIYGYSNSLFCLCPSVRLARAVNTLVLKQKTIMYADQWCAVIMFSNSVHVH